MPLHHPFVQVVVLIKQAAQQANSGQYKEATEEANLHHEPLQFVRSIAVVLHHGADAKQRDEAGHKEEGTDAQVDAQGQQQEHSQRMAVQLTDETNAAQHVT